tara:strand:+ start:221 stop:403 length:183 start_codon:yes stop_codon:yes gene_type:complete
MEDNEIPKDLGIKIGTKLEALWTKVKDESSSLIKQSEDNLIIQRAMLQLAEDNIKAEQSK